MNHIHKVNKENEEKGVNGKKEERGGEKDKFPIE